MQRWEYCEVIVREPTVVQVLRYTAQGRDWTEHRGRDPGDQPLAQVLYQLGNAGWELVSVDRSISYYFKRPTS